MCTVSVERNTPINVGFVGPRFEKGELAQVSATKTYTFE